MPCKQKRDRRHTAAAHPCPAGPGCRYMRTGPGCNQIRPPYDCLQIHTTATGLQPICNLMQSGTTAIRLFADPYDCNQTATYLQPHAIRYDRHTTAIRLFADPYDCNQIRPPYDRHIYIIMYANKICLQSGRVQTK